MEAVSYKPPSQEDLTQTQRIDEILAKYDPRPSDADQDRKVECLKRIETIWEKWTLSVTSGRAKGAILPFGSYRLGVDTVAGGDIDTICLAPFGITHEKVFESLPAVLQLRPAEFQNLFSVPNSFVPRITFHWHGTQEVDLTFAQLRTTLNLDQVDLADAKVLFTDARSVVSLNGPRVTDAIIKAVPSPAAFRRALRYVRLWAKRRCIYSNVMGYPGGVSYALMVAFVCILYPRAAPSYLVRVFFMVFAVWKWPKAVCIHDVTIKPPPDLGSLRVWSPSEADVMCIITPSYPHANSTFNVTQSTFRTILAELTRAQSLITASTDDSLWDRIIEANTFFCAYQDVLELRVSADTDAALRPWQGFVESRMRHLIQALEANKTKVQFCPHPRKFASSAGTDADADAGPLSCLYFIGVMSADTATITTTTETDAVADKDKISKIMKEYTDMLLSSTEIECRTPDMTASMRTVAVDDLPEWVHATATQSKKRKRKETVPVLLNPCVC